VLTVFMYAAYTAFGLVALLMVFAILLQEGKGGGLSALGGTQAESAFGSSNPIRRATVVLSIIFFLLAGILTYVRSGRRDLFEEKQKTEQGTSLTSDVPADASDDEASKDTSEDAQSGAGDESSAASEATTAGDAPAADEAATETPSTPAADKSEEAPAADAVPAPAASDATE
jgi:protein translocase SecG subunit